MLDPIFLLKCAYLFNVVFFIPISAQMLNGTNEQTGENLPINRSSSFLVASMWASIVISSILGWFYPSQFWSILFLQVVYQFIYLCVYVLPLLLYNKMDEIPKVTAFFFGCISMTYSIILTMYWFSN